MGRVGQLVQEVNKRKRVIDEAEFGLKQVTEQKRMVQDIEAQIAQSKVDPVTQFEHWYSMQYGQMSGDAHDGALHDLQDTGEQFDSMEHDRLEKIHPDGAVPFFKARKDFRAHHSHP